MTCPKCGAELEKGKLYCSKCGNEIQMVPDFEPEIENSITETLNTVAKDAVLSEETLESSENEIQKKKGRWKVPVIGVIFCVLLLLILGMILGTGIYRDNYIKIQVNKAKDAFAKDNYVEAANLYETIISIDDSESSNRISLAECYYKMGETKKAISEYNAIIALDEHNELAYAQLVSIYEEMGDYASINSLLMECGDEKIQYEFQGYMAKEPEFNYESGTYSEVIPLKLLAPSFGKIYYTLDGSNPGKGSLIYTAPIFLKQDTCTISAVYINDYGIASNIVRKTYTIDAQIPNPPVISPSSGSYLIPQLISVEVPPDCNVYYTTDGSVPTENSSIYGEPIPMAQGNSAYNFITITKEGVASEVVPVTYHMEVITKLSEQKAIETLRFRLVAVGHLLDAEGNLENMNGKNIYVFNSLRYIDDRILYFIYEYYKEDNQSRNMTGNIYAVDADDGRVYKANKGENGSYSIEAF